MAISSLVSLCFIWYLFFWLYRDYRLDRFRNNLFTLRDELFDLAADGEIAFDDDAYGILRSTINGTIQHGHRLGLIELLCARVFVSREQLRRHATEYQRDWDHACGTLAPAVREKLLAIRRRHHRYLAEQVILTSAVMMFSLTVLIALLVLYWLGDTCLRRMSRLFYELDSTAYLRASRGLGPHGDSPAIAG
ncbi:MAG: hypothetical protein R3C10_20595 [Pirellulales bacterium]